MNINIIFGWDTYSIRGAGKCGRDDGLMRNDFLKKMCSFMVYLHFYRNNLVEKNNDSGEREYDYKNNVFGILEETWYRAQEDQMAFP